MELPMLNRTCGACHACCISPHIPVLTKPAGEPCRYLQQGMGCAVYERRPMACRDFRCVWIDSPILDDSLRPDRCGAMFEAYHEERVVIMTALQPKTWMCGEPSRLIAQMLHDDYPVWVIDGKDRHLLLPAGMSQETAEHRTMAAWRRQTWQQPAIQPT